MGKFQYLHKSKLLNNIKLATGKEVIVIHLVVEQKKDKLLQKLLYYYYIMNIHELFCVFIRQERFSIDRLRGISSQLLLPEALFVNVRGLLKISNYNFYS